jgi:hypothetical protein|tara:strand:+ start:3087 stop:3248 length:162 start_codon:yes stop_codon:yes gene_type:complete
MNNCSVGSFTFISDKELITISSTASPFLIILDVLDGNNIKACSGVVDFFGFFL